MFLFKGSEGMEDIRNKIENIKNDISDIKDNEYKSIFEKITLVLDNMLDKFENMSSRQDYLEENVQYMDEDLTGLQEELFEEVSIEDIIDMDDEYIEVNCNNCTKPFFVEKESLDKNKEIPCPFCNKNII